MEVTRATVLDMLYECLIALNEMRSPDQQLARSPDTALTGGGNGLDSLGFVNLVALVEEKILERFGKTLVLSEVSPAADGQDPLSSVGTLADYLTGKLSQPE